VVYFSSSAISCPQYSQRKDATGQVHYYHAALTPVIVKPGSPYVLPLAPEFIQPQDGHAKQDCEQVAARRWLQRQGASLPPASRTYLLIFRSVGQGLLVKPFLLVERVVI